MRVSLLLSLFVLACFAAVSAAQNCDATHLNGMNNGRLDAIRACVKGKQKPRDLKIYHRGPQKQWEDWQKVKNVHTYNLGFQAARYPRVYKSWMANLPIQPLPVDQKQCWNFYHGNAMHMVRCISHFRAKYYDTLFWNKVTDEDFMLGFSRGIDLPTSTTTELSDTYGNGVYFSNHNNFIKSHGPTLSLCTFKVLPVFSLDLHTDEGKANQAWLREVQVLPDVNEHKAYEGGAVKTIKNLAKHIEEFESIFEGATIEFRSSSNDTPGDPLYYVVKSHINVGYDCRLSPVNIDILQNNKF